MNDTVSEPPDLSQLLRREEERKRAQASAISDELKKGILPSPEPLVRAIVWRPDRLALMRDHVYAKEHKLRSGLDALVSAALLAHLDLSRAEAALTAFAQAHDAFRDHIEHTVDNPAQKEVMAFCAAYAGTIDTLRRFEARRPDIWADIDDLRRVTTGDVRYRFIFELRRNLSHGSVVVPYSLVRRDAEGTTGSIHFSARELLAFGKWNVDVRAYLTATVGDSFSITAVTAFCAEGLAKFRRDLGILFARHRTLAELDFHAINDLSRRLGGGGFNKIVLKRLVERGVDPLAYLRRFFSPEETRRILEYPPHSMEQVEYAIRLREARNHFDAETRALIYQLFKVPATIDVPPKPPSIDPKPLGDLWPPRAVTMLSSEAPHEEQHADADVRIAPSDAMGRGDAER